MNREDSRALLKAFANLIQAVKGIDDPPPAVLDALDEIARIIAPEIGPIPR